MSGQRMLILLATVIFLGSRSGANAQDLICQESEQNPTLWQWAEADYGSASGAVAAESFVMDLGEVVNVVRWWGIYKDSTGDRGCDAVGENFTIYIYEDNGSRLPGTEVWLILRRNPITGKLKTYLSNAPEETSHTTLVRVSGMRWPIETTFEDSKQLVGMGDYQVRSWIGWHHHMTMCILAHFFLVRLQVRLGDKAPALTLPQAKLLLMGVLPKQEFDADWVLEVIGYRQRRNHAAYISHRKRRLKMLGQSDDEISL